MGPARSTSLISLQPGGDSPRKKATTADKSMELLGESRLHTAGLYSVAHDGSHPCQCHMYRPMVFPLSAEIESSPLSDTFHLNTAY